MQSDDFAYASREDLPDDFVTYQNASATKSWFLLDDEIVVLAAGVGDATRAVTTTLDTRIAAPTDSVTITGAQRDGSPWTGAGPVSPRWLRYTNGSSSVGYHFLEPTALSVDLQAVTRSRRVVRTSNPDTAVTKQVFALTVTQPADSKRSLAYALVPNATESALKSYQHGRIALLANTTRLQAVQHLGLRLTAANTFAPGSHNLPGLTVDGPASLIIRRAASSVQVAVSDPTTQRDTITINLRAQYLKPSAPVDGIQVTRTVTGTRLTFTTRHTYGRSLAIKLLPAW
jgi:hyaluronate lyase